jgi:hypothetical protein
MRNRKPATVVDEDVYIALTSFACATLAGTQTAVVAGQRLRGELPRRFPQLFIHDGADSLELARAKVALEPPVGLSEYTGPRPEARERFRATRTITDVTNTPAGPIMRVCEEGTVVFSGHPVLLAHPELFESLGMEDVLVQGAGVDIDAMTVVPSGVSMVGGG